MRCGCKSRGTETVEDRNCWIPRQFLLKGPCTDLLRVTSSQLHSQGCPVEGTRETGGEELNGLASGQELGGSYVPDRRAGRGHGSFAEPSPERVGRQVLCLGLHPPGSHSLPHPGNSLRPCPPNIQAHPAVSNCSRPSSSSSQPWLTVWPGLDPSKPSTRGCPVQITL